MLSDFLIFFERIELIQTWDTKSLPSRQFCAWLWHNTRDVYAAVRIAICSLVLASSEVAKEKLLSYNGTKYTKFEVLILIYWE